MAPNSRSGDDVLSGATSDARASMLGSAAGGSDGFRSGAVTLHASHTDEIDSSALERQTANLAPFPT